MTEEERVKQMKEKSVVFLAEWLAELEEGTKTLEDLLSLTYALMIIMRILGYAPDKMLVDAEVAAERINELVDENDVDNSSETV
jgi:hypothetical protein